MQPCNFANLQLCNLQFVTCSFQRAVFNVQFPMCSFHRAVFNVQFAMCSLQRAVCNVKFATCSLQDAVCKMQFSVCMSCHSSGSLEGGGPYSAEVIGDTEDFVYYSGFYSPFERFLRLRFERFLNFNFQRFLK